MQRIVVYLEEYEAVIQERDRFHRELVDMTVHACEVTDQRDEARKRAEAEWERAEKVEAENRRLRELLLAKVMVEEAA